MTIVDAGLDVGIAGLADRRDAAVLDADVALDDAPVIDDHRVGDDGVQRTVGSGELALPHAVADDLAAAELHLFAVVVKSLLDLDLRARCRPGEPVARGRAEHLAHRRDGVDRHHTPFLTGAFQRAPYVAAEAVHLASSGE